MPYTRTEMSETIAEEVKRRRPWWRSFVVIIEPGDMVFAEAPHGERVQLRSWASKAEPFHRRWAEKVRKIVELTSHAG